jgi:hypothetical protein
MGFEADASDPSVFSACLFGEKVEHPIREPTISAAMRVGY